MVAMVEGSVELLKKYLFEHGCDPVYPCERLRSHCIASCSDVCMSGDMELELRNRSGSIAPMTKITSLYFLQLG